jgi:ribulose-phosphate 3-epimerase
MSTVKIAPSILSADFSILGEEVRAVEKAGADLIHCDVMDGHFVPNITIGPLVIRALRPITALELDVHLMITDPDTYAPQFAEAGADNVSFHPETSKDPGALIKKLRGMGKRVGLVLNPDKPLDLVIPHLGKVQRVLFMSVYPGFGGQKFIPEVQPKIRELAGILRQRKLAVDLQIDGGINDTTAKEAVRAGINTLVTGSYVYDSDDYAGRIRALRG